MNEQIGVGLVGLGRSGWDIHAAGLADLPTQYRIVAVADPLVERRTEARERFDCRTYDSVDQLATDDEVELVVVAVPSYLHADVALTALQAGKHVVVEKPVSRTVADLDQLVAAAEGAGRIVTVFQNQRLDPSFLAAQEIFASGRIGDLVLVRRTTHRYQRRTDWQTLRDHGGGELGNTAIHYFDQLLTLIDLDVPVELFADLRHVVSAGDAEDHVKLTVRPERGPVIDVESSLAVAVPQDSWFVVGSRGTVTGSASELTVTWTDLADAPALEAVPDSPPDRGFGTGETLTWQTETVTVPDPTWRTQGYYERLYATVRHGAELFVTPASVRRVSALMEQARRGTAFT